VRVRRADTIVLGAALAATAIIHAVAAARPYDDAWILFRYVRNVLDGNGPVYNAGERVFGVSCPLYLLWLVLLKGVFAPIPIADLAVRCNAIFLIAAAIAARGLLVACGVGRLGAALAAAAIALSDGILRASLGGMESSLCLALVFASLLALARHRDRMAVLLAALSALTRPEGVLVLLVCLAFCGRRPRDWAPGVALLAAWAAAATWYYGTPIPHSLIAKARPLYPLPPGEALRFMMTRIQRWLFPPDLADLSWMGGWGLAIAAAALGVALFRWRPPGPMQAVGTWRAAALPICLAGLLAAYAAGNPLVLEWYLPLFQASWIAVLAGAAMKPGPWGAPRVASACLAALTTATLLYVTTTNLTVSTTSNLMTQGGAGPRETTKLEAYAQAAAWLRQNSSPEATVAAAEIGRLGYELDRPILDACGLVTPAALPFIPAPPEERGNQLGPIPSAFVRATRPDYLVTLPAFAERSLLSNAWFTSAYQLVHEVPINTKNPGYRAVLVYRRKE
jgi:arabinofuranosyltransferase